ncbi:MAG: hypothetical protein HC799_07590 [Limnothrix sp. RL_2_0]|nr:hypothetical protein [Limnothrix sp. RL_2_0]
MPLSEVEVDDWETPVEFSPAERLAQNTGDTYVPSLDDFDQDDLGDLLGDDDAIDDVFEDGDIAKNDTSSAEPVLMDEDEAAVVGEMSAPAVTDPEGIEPFDASLFDGDLGEESSELAPELVVVDSEIDSAVADVDTDDLDFDADGLDGLLDDGEEFYDDSELEVSDATTVIEDKELTFDAVSLEELSEDADVVAEADLDIGAGFDASAENVIDDFGDLAIADHEDDLRRDLLGEEESPESTSRPTLEATETLEATDQSEPLPEEEPDAPDLAVPKASTPEAIDSNDNTALIEPEADPSAESPIPDDELLQFLGQDWQSYPGVSEITSLDEELESNSGEPAVLQPLSEEELADLEDVEDTDWFASSLDNNWPPLGDTGTALSGMDFSPNFVEEHGESGGTGQLESPQEDDFDAVDELNADLGGEWDALDGGGTETFSAIEDNAFTPLELEDEPTLAEATDPAADDFSAMDEPDDGSVLGDDGFEALAMDDVDNFDAESMDMAAIADVGLDPLETMEFSTDDIDFELNESASPEDETLSDISGEAIVDVDTEPAMAAEQPDFTTLPDPFAENLDAWMDQDNDEKEEVDLSLNPEASMPMEIADIDATESPEEAESDMLLDPFADWSDDEDSIGDLGKVDLPDLNDAGVDFADSEISTEMPLESLDIDGEDEIFGDPLTDLDEDDDTFGGFGDLDLTNLEDVTDNFLDSDSSMAGEAEALSDPFADLGDEDGVSNLGDLNVGYLSGEDSGFADDDFSVNAEVGDFSEPLVNLDGDGDVLGNLDDVTGDFSDGNMADPFADLGEDDTDISDLDLSDLGDFENDDLSMDEVSFDAAGTELGDESFADPFANLDGLDLDGEDDPQIDLSDLEASDFGDMVVDDPLAAMDDGELSMGSLGGLEFPSLGDADLEMDDDDLSSEVLNSIQELDASTAELNLPNAEGDSALGLMEELATSGDSNVDDAGLLPFSDTDDGLDFESLALESELELTDLGDNDGMVDLDFDGMDGASTFDDGWAIAADDNDGDTSDSWNDLGLGDSAEFSLADADDEDSYDSIDLDLDLDFTDAEEPLPAISLDPDAETNGDWQDLELPATDEPASDNADWEALQNTVENNAKSTNGEGLDNWAIADLDLEGLNDLGDANLGELGDLDLDSLGADDDTEDFDLFGPDDDDDDTDIFNLLFESET